MIKLSNLVLYCIRIKYSFAHSGEVLLHFQWHNQFAKWQRTKNKKVGYVKLLASNATSRIFAFNEILRCLALNRKTFLFRKQESNRNKRQYTEANSATLFLLHIKSNWYYHSALWHYSTKSNSSHWMKKANTNRL